MGNTLHKKNNLNNFFIHFLSENINKFDLTRHSIFMCRADGVPLFFHNSKKFKDSESTVGALLAGAWQASHSLASFIPNSSLNSEFRLSFGSSSSGIYAMPVNINDKEFYLGMIYSEEINPGKIKSILRLLINEMEQEAKCVIDHPSNTQHSDNKDEYLFKDISDKEINKLFSFVGN